MDEVWKPITEFDGRYEVSNLGRVRSLYRNPTSKAGRPRVLLEDPRILKLWRNHRGYPMVSLWSGDQKKKSISVHLLVLTYFVGPRPEGYEGRHLNDQKDDNRLENLAWGTKQENLEDCRRNGHDPSGERHPMRKLSKEDVLWIRENYQSDRGLWAQEQAKRFGVRPQTIWRVGTGRLWKNVSATDK